MAHRVPQRHRPGAPLHAAFAPDHRASASPAGARHPAHVVALGARHDVLARGVRRGDFHTQGVIARATPARRRPEVHPMPTPTRNVWTHRPTPSLVMKVLAESTYSKRAVFLVPSLARTAVGARM